jgi:type IV secretory pathway protease TraF
LERGYPRTGPRPGDAKPVGKIALAIPGDAVVIESDGLTINGKRFAHSAVASHDSAEDHFRKSPFGRYTVGTDQVGLFGFRNRRSWDARYFCPIPVRNVQGSLASRGERHE